MNAASSAVRGVVRVFRRSPGLTAGVTLTLGVGLGGCLAIVGLLHDRLLAEWPFRDPAELVLIENTGKYYFEGRLPDGLVSPWLSGPDFEDLSVQTRSLAECGAAVTYTGFMLGGDRPRPVSRVLVTPRLMTLLAPPPGRDVSSVRPTSRPEPPRLLCSPSPCGGADSPRRRQPVDHRPRADYARRGGATAGDGPFAVGDAWVSLC